MARRRPPSRKWFFPKSSVSKQRPTRPQRHQIEALEERLQFVVLHGGDVFEFSTVGGQTSTHWVRVTVTGANTTVELVGATVTTPAGFTATLNGMDGEVILGPDAGIVGQGFLSDLATPPQVVESIYAIDVVQADATSSISIAEVPAPAPGLRLKQRPMEPYNTGNTLEVTQTGISGGTGVNIPVTGPTTGGSVLVGALTNSDTNPQANNVPILSATAAPGQFTYVPAGNVTPGLTINATAFGSFQLGGTMTGNVTIHGSIQTFYAGWLVTGNADGEINTAIVSDPHNFSVDGDIQNLLTNGPIGSDTEGTAAPQYSTGFDLYVAGRVGQINTQGDFFGDLTVANSNPAVGVAAGTPVNEQEFLGTPVLQPFPALPTDSWDQGVLGNGAFFLTNDTFQTAQYLGADSAGNITVDGILQSDLQNNDVVDYYAVSLMAGQTVTVQVTETSVAGITFLGTSKSLDAGVFDPDDRLIATDFNKVDATQTQEEPFQFTASVPGVYRIAVAQSGNSNFATAAPSTILADFGYALTIKNVGNLAVGGLVSAVDIFDNPNGSSVSSGTAVLTSAIDGLHVLNGDFGAAVAANFIASEYGDTANGVDTFAVDNGNLRAVVAGNIGHIVSWNRGSELIESQGPDPVPGGFRTNLTGHANAGTTMDWSPSAAIPNGSVGLLEADAANGILAWNVFTTTTVTLTQAQASQFAIGGDYELVSAESIFAGDLIANGNIGTIRASDMATSPASYLQVNASDNPAVKGTIDLIDVQSFLGDVADGGPAITTGPGGNVRYIHLGPYGIAYRDILFGGGEPDITPYQPGESVTITDDSGTQVLLTPVGGTPATNFNPAQPVYTTPASLFVTTYPIRGSGGAAILEVESTDSLQITGSGVGPGQSAEIGKIVLDGIGTATTLPTAPPPPTAGTTPQFPGAGTPGGPPIKVNNGQNQRYQTQTVPPAPTLPANPTPLTLTYNGSIAIDTYEVTTTPTPATFNGTISPNQGFITALTNSTPGEIVNMHLNSVGTITSGGPIGLVSSNTPAAVEGLMINPLSEDTGPLGNPWDYPFLQPRQLVRILGSVISITAPEVANVYIGMVIMSDPGDFSAPSYDPFNAQQPPIVGTPAVGGPGIASGTGGLGSITGNVLGPIVAGGFIDNAIATNGVGAGGSGALGGPGFYSAGVIGQVNSSGDFRGVETSPVGQIGLTVNGVIMQASIGTYARFDYNEMRAGTVQIPNTFPNPITFPKVDIGSVTATGGIIGTEIVGDHMGTISVGPKGFGMFDSYISMLGEGTLSSLVVNGYGIRDGLIQGGAQFGVIQAKGDGSDLPVTNFSSSVRQSETGELFDPATGYLLSFLNDIDLFLGTSAATPNVVGVTDSGVIEDLTVEGSRNLGSVTAYSIRGRVLPTLVNVVPGFQPALTPSVTTFNVANAIGTLTVTGPVNGFNLTSGRASTYVFGGDVSDFDLTIAGPIGNLVFRSSLGGTSSINAIGPSGHIGVLTIRGNLAGTVSSQTYITNLTVNGNVSGTVTAKRIGTIHVAGTVGDGGLTINGPLGRLIVDHGFGPAGNPIQVNGNATTIRINGDLAANVNVTGKLTQLIVNGSILSGETTTIGGPLNLLRVAGDIQAGATVHAELIRRQIVKGQILGTITTP